MSAVIGREYLIALGQTRPHDLLSLTRAGVGEATIAAIPPAIARITVGRNGLFQPDPEGGQAFMLPVRVQDAVSPEASDPEATVRVGEIVDLVAFDPAHPLKWALRRGVAEWLGSIGPQYMPPVERVPIWRSPTGWLRAGGRGLVILSPDAAHRILTGCVGGTVAEDWQHQAQLNALLRRPWLHVPAIVTGGGRHAL